MPILMCYLQLCVDEAKDIVSFKSVALEVNLFINGIVFIGIVLHFVEHFNNVVEYHIILLDQQKD